MICVSEKAALQTATAPEFQSARAAFDKQHYLHLPGFIHPTFLQQILSQLRTANFVPKSHHGIARELVCWDSPAADALQFVFNDPHLFALITELTGISPIGCYVGRIYRMAPSHAHHEDWHDDVGDHRLLALSVNLSEEPYQGGTTLLRTKIPTNQQKNPTNLPTTVIQLPNPVPGDALLFRLRPDLEHTITDVLPGPPKTAWAGWFKSQPLFLDVLTRHSPL
ncbi:MAG: 2OG-Fe(II) oxygenase [Polyangiaceae bacterium]|nr:2OG-Fe(II) oxygenase [Polyangiaceae bacterium]